MPPEVAAEEIVVVEKSRRRAERFDALLRSTLHLEDVGQPVQSPQVLRLQDQGLSCAPFGQFVMADLLHGEGVRRQKVSIAWHLSVPIAGYARAHFGLVAFVPSPEEGASVLPHMRHPERRLVPQQRVRRSPTPTR